LARSRPIVVTFMRGVSWLTSLAPRAYGCDATGAGDVHPITTTSATASPPCSPRSTCSKGTVLGRCMQRHQEFLRFLNAIEAAVPAGKVIHGILDNYASHKHPKVLRWFARHPRFVFHFTPTSGAWLNAVETFFSALTRIGSSAAAFSRSSTSTPRSTATSPSTTTIPSRSPGRADPPKLNPLNAPVQLVLRADTPRLAPGSCLVLGHAP
jgi:DDE superfamily endonuclease